VARAGWAAAHVGSEADVLFETRLEDGRWVGHAADHTLVAAPSSAPSDFLENHIGRVRIAAVDPTIPDRVTGRILSLSPPPLGVAVDGH